MSVPKEAMTAKPDSSISLGDFTKKAKEEGCVVLSGGGHTYIGERKAGGPGLKYPHIHVWVNGTIALSFAHNKNTRIGLNGEIDIKALNEAFLEHTVEPGSIRNTIGWVLASAS